ncbi:MAG TPA: thiamine pyrophosphate-binding protein [Polyangiaceae bacterium]|jgi:acetolactate synthase-1/2/3 large subunit|nr:thiamine pyrophosphate-binding protein [Polyangiaceae bacterium]
MNETHRVADFFAELLVREGVEVVFTIPGGTAMPLLEAISRRKSIRTVVAKDEAGAAFMADGYAWASGKPGVVVTIGGPGATNALTGLCCSAAQGNPVVLVSGEVPTVASGRRAVQDGTDLEIPVTAMSRPATVLSTTGTNAESAKRALEEAFRRALHARRPAHVSLPLDVQRAELPSASVGRGNYRVPEESGRGVNPESIRGAAAVLANGRKMALLVGRGARGAESSLVALAERLGCAVATTCSGKGLFPERHPLSIGVFSFAGGPLARAVLTGGLDVLCAIGTGLGEFATMNFSDKLRPLGALVHLDRDPAVLGRNYPCLPICGDARLAVPALVASLGASPQREARVPSWLTSLAREHERFQHPWALESEASPIRPERVIRELERVLPENACVLADIGTSCAFVAHCLRLSPPQRCYIPMAWSCMGHPLGASLGVRLGSGNPTFCVTGDGAFLAKGFELHAAVEAKVSRFVWIVLSNGGHGLVRMGTEAALGKDHGIEVGTFRETPDIERIARALGAEAARVDDPSALASTLRRAAECERPFVVEVRVDEAARPPMEDRIQGLNPACVVDAS